MNLYVKSIIQFFLSFTMFAHSLLQANNLSVQVVQKSQKKNQIPYQAKLFLLSQGLERDEDIRQIETIDKYAPLPISSYLKNASFEGKYEQIAQVPLVVNGEIINHIFIGLGKPAKNIDDSCEYLRRSIASVMPLVKNLKIAHLLVEIPRYLEEICKRTYEELVRECSLATLMHDYSYDEFRQSKKNDNDFHPIITFLIPENKEMEFVEKACKEASIIASSLNEARCWMDGPANKVTPTFMAEQAKKIAARNENLVCHILEESDAKNLGMGAFLAVSKGSSQSGKIVILEYKSDSPHAQTIALCGKGITYDTGGVSLKTPGAMLGMKYDMCGGASVLAIMNLVAQFKPHCNVIGIVPFAENMPDGNAYREDDILTAMNGKTIEVITTDAEGRLVLADALCYAEKVYHPDIIIDIATLTGACPNAVGRFYTAFMTKDSDLMQLLQFYGYKTGDRMWPLPFHDDYKKANKSDIADVKNKGSYQYQAYCIEAGKFLENFVENARWAHLDIAGSGWSAPGINYLGNGATGAGIRTILYVIMNYSAQARLYKEINEFHYSQAKEKEAALAA